MLGNLWHGCMTKPQGITCVNPTGVHTTVTLPEKPSCATAGGPTPRWVQQQCTFCNASDLFLCTKHYQSLTYFCLQLLLNKTFLSFLFAASCPDFLLAFHAVSLHVRSDPILFFGHFLITMFFGCNPPCYTSRGCLIGKSLQINRKIDCTLLLFSSPDSLFLRASDQTCPLPMDV